MGATSSSSSPSSQSAANEDGTLHFTLLGQGAAGIDYIAILDSYPSPDDKVRVKEATQAGGGNVANTLTAVSRLAGSTGRCKLLTRIGKDSAGAAVVAELQADGVDTSLVMASSATSTGFTYVLVDASTSTRTCIHTPQQEELSALDVTAAQLDGVEWVHLDSRHTAAALELARLATARSIPVSLDAEKNRPPHFDALVRLCDILFTNERFPALYLGDTSTISAEGSGELQEQRDEEAVLALFALPGGLRAHTVVMSLGARGALLVSRATSSPPSASSVSQELDLVSAACARLDLLTVQTHSRVAAAGDHFRVLRCSAWPLLQADVVDTTGAGDAFIGGFLFARLHGATDEQSLQVGTLCAAGKIRRAGARAGLPTLKEMLAALGREEARP